MFKPRRKSLQSLLDGRTTSGDINITFSSNIYIHVVCFCCNKGEMK